MNTLYRNATRYLTGRVLFAIVGVLTPPVLMRVMDPAEYIGFSTSIALIGSVAALTGGWVSQSQLRFYHRFHAEPTLERILIHAAMASLVIGVCAVFILLKGQGLGNAVYWSIAYLGLATYGLLISRLQAEQKSQSVLTADLTRALGSCIALAAIAFLISPVHSGESSLVTSIGALFGIVAWLANRRKFASPQIVSSLEQPVGSWNWSSWKTLLIYGIPIGVWLAMNSSYSLIERLAIRSGFEISVAASYLAISDLVYKGVALITLPVVQAAHPELIRLIGVYALKEARALSLSSAKIILTLGVGTSVVMWLAFPLLTQFLGLQEGEGLRAVPAIHALGASAWAVALILHKPLEALSRTMLMLTYMSVSALAFGALAFIAVIVNSLELLASCYLLSASIYMFLVTRGIKRGLGRN